MRYLADTNTLIAWTARRDAAVERRMALHQGSVACSAIVSFELYFGAFKSGRQDRNLREVAGLDLPVLSFDGDDARAAAKIRDELRRLGAPIGPYDVLIAGQALARNLTLITNNVGEFGRVQELRVEDWTAAA